jgi:hypothetical protein
MPILPYFAAGTERLNEMQDMFLMLEFYELE